MQARTIAVMAVCIAFVTVMVAVVQVPIPATGGYWHVGAVAEIFVAMAFGPLVGMVAAGVGAATADLLLGYGSFAPLTLIAHGAFGLLAGLIGWKKSEGVMLVGWVVGGLALVAIYFFGEATVYDFGIAGAGQEVPLNLFQVSLGMLGFLLFGLVRSAYPQVEGLAGGVSFREE